VFCWFYLNLQFQYLCYEASIENTIKSKDIEIEELNENNKTQKKKKKKSMKIIIKLLKSMKKMFLENHLPPLLHQHFKWKLHVSLICQQKTL
jgi:hypothetical protein